MPRDLPTANPASLNARGRPFAKGNSGRPRGSKNRITVVATSLLDGEVEALMRKAVEGALGGDGALLKFLLARLLPRERTIQVDLPSIKTADEAVKALSQILDAVTQGHITPGEGAALTTIVNSYAHAIDIAQLVNRVDQIETQLKGVRA